MEVIIESTLTCPICGQAEKLIMPTDSCLFFHKCASCQNVLRPKPTHCCVFCSYGDVPCPSIQQHSSCCSRGGADNV